MSVTDLDGVASSPDYSDQEASQDDPNGEIASAKKNTWEHVDGTTFMVRKGPDYATNKKKSNSGPSFYKLISAKLCKSSVKILQVGKRFDIPKAPYQSPDPDVPSILIWNVLFPLYTPPNPLGWTKKEDGEGVVLPIYFGLSKEGVEALQDPTNNAASLLKRVFKNTDKDSEKDRDRFKCIGRLCNPQDMEIGSWLRSLMVMYNAKPFLIRPQHHFFWDTSDKGDKYLEYAMDVHTFGYAVKKGLNGMLLMLETMVFDLALVLEGDLDDELPEQILCGARLHYVDLKAALDLG